MVDGRSMPLGAQEESLVRALPPEEDAKVFKWAHQLADLDRGRAIEWSDSWTHDDLADATAASVRRFEEQEVEDR